MNVTQTKNVRLVLFGKSDIGMVRGENQDSFCIHLPELPEWKSTRGQLVVLADGMGGLAHGGQASRLAVETLRDAYYQAEGSVAEALLKAAEEANARIFQEAQNHPGGQPMGSTLTAVAFLGDRATIAQVGDSRAYRIAEESGLAKLTRDHTLVQELADRGEIEPDSLHYLLNRNVLTRGLGLQEHVDVDIFEIEGIRSGETFVLCSDGLYDVVAESEIEGHALSFGADVESLVEHLIELARGRGAPDNVTLVAIRVQEPESESAAQHRLLAFDGSAAAPGSAPGKSTLFTPLSYFAVFALGALVTLFLEERPAGAPSSAPEPPVPGAAAAELLDRSEVESALDAYRSAAPEAAARFEEELGRLRQWLDDEQAGGR